MKKNRKIQMAVLFFGDENQRNVNEQQFDFLKSVLIDFKLLKYDFNLSVSKKQLLEDYVLGKIDIVLKNAYGRGHEMVIEKVLEKNHIPFLGSDSSATFNGTSKYLSKEIFKDNSLLVADDLFVNYRQYRLKSTEIVNKAVKIVGLPCVLKDVGGTDSRGLFFCLNKNDLQIGIEKIVKSNHDAIIEKFIESAYEVTCFVYDVGMTKISSLTPIGIVKSEPIISGEQKDKLNIKMRIPADLPSHILENIKKIAIKAHQVLGCRDFSRSDLLIKGENIYLLEVDVHPGFRRGGSIDKLFAYENISFNSFFKKLYEQHIRKQN